MTEFDLWKNHEDCLDCNENPKKRYFSETEAKNMANYLTESKGVLLRVYHCVDCGYWHLTRSAKKYADK